MQFNGHSKPVFSILVVGALILTQAGCSLLPPRASEQGLADISTAALQAHMSFLADDRLAGRMTGEPGHEIAAAYVASQFRAMELEPAGQAGGYLQPVPLLATQLDIPGSSLILHGLPGGDALEFRKDYVIYPKTRAHSALRAPLVFTGHGVVAPTLGHDDYADLDVRGKILVVFSGAPRTFPADERAFYSSGVRKSQFAAERGAVGLIVLRTEYERQHYAWDDSVRNSGTQPSMYWIENDGRPADVVTQMKATLQLSDALAQRLFATAGHTLEELLRIEAAGEALPRFNLRPQASVTTRSRIHHLSSPNVVARLPGTDPALAGQHVVLVAHLDHLGIGAAVDGDDIYNGAYDNAMGVGLMLETARALKRMGTRRSVLFAAVTAEERGLLGSRYLATHPPAGVEQMVAAVTLDMPLLLFPLKEVIGFGVEHSNLGQYVRPAAEAEAAILAPDPLPDEVLFVRSDHYSFVRSGIPGLFFFPGFGSADAGIDGAALVHAHLGTHYHKPSDDMRRPVHWPSALKFARINARFAKAMADSVEPPRWAEGNFFAAQYLQAR